MISRKSSTSVFPGQGLRWPLLILLLGVIAVFPGCSLGPSGPSRGSGAVDGTAVSRTALSAVGTRYAYGGSSPAKGFDCSGLVCWTYQKHGLGVPRTAKEQSRFGTQVAKSKLRPGDVVVFRISSGLHTGIYTGNGKFVHSPSSGKKVRVDKLEDSYWRNRFVAGRRHGELR